MTWPYHCNAIAKPEVLFRNPISLSNPTDLSKKVTRACAGAWKSRKNYRVGPGFARSIRVQTFKGRRNVSSTERLASRAHSCFHPFGCRFDYVFAPLDCIGYRVAHFRSLFFKKDLTSFC